MLFASGNLAEAHNQFEKDHKCNKFCHFFDLPVKYTEYDTEDSEDGEEALKMTAIEQSVLSGRVLDDFQTREMSISMVSLSHG